eukprot:66673-Rhodomonas_salina.2
MSVWDFAKRSDEAILSVLPENTPNSKPVIVKSIPSKACVRVHVSVLALRRERVGREVDSEREGGSYRDVG